ncbi:MAG: class 3 adenylate cyclase/tetratricopeptide (TPR) repeat protein [Planctomycetota bacterium]|jgi:class 3 adenylate cyclase/tetratricopeptide (TPR) repeat protein
MECLSCAAPNDPESLFCEACGSALERQCAHCDGKSKPSARFCRHCGEAFAADAGASALTAEPPPPNSPEHHDRTPIDYTPRHLTEKILHNKSALEGERKQVTVLFADVKGSMELAAALGAENWHVVLDRFFGILNDGVHQFEGTVNQYTGDGIMALFGAPIAHEDHAQRACYAALQQREMLRAFSQDVKRQHGVDFAVRFGINSGDVVVGKIGDDLRMDYTAQGATVGLAQRMESLASGGSIYLAEGAVRLVGGYFDLEDLGEFNIKGSDTSVSVHELIGEGALRTRFDVSRQRGLSRFVGRDGEMKILDDAVEQAAIGNGQVVGLVADAGTGKSRLSFEFVERCRARGLQVNVGRCLAHGKNIPFLPVLEIIRGYYGITPQDDDRTAREKVAGRMLLIDERYRDALPLIFEFIGIPDPERPAPPLPPEARQRQLFGVLRSITQAGGAGGQEASVVLIEDLHWSDGGSEAWIAEWVDATAGGRTMVLLNFRPEYHAPWMQRSHYQQIALAPLSPEAIGELLDELIGKHESTQQMPHRIHQLTAGNPFFAEEVVQSLIESGQLEGSRGAYRLTQTVDKLRVPASVQAVLSARIDRLGEDEKNVLQVASVIGKTFLQPVLAEAAKMSPEDLDRALAVLRTNEFVHEVSLYPVAEYSFKHPLTQQVALESLLGERRRAIHRAVAEVLEQTSRNVDEDAALLATHWDGASEPMRAAPWHLRAADWTGAKDVHEVAKHAHAVLDALRDRDQEDGATHHLALASARLVNLGWRLGIDAESAEALYRDGRRWAQADNNPGIEAQIAGGQGAVHALAGRLEACMECAREFERLAVESGDPELQLVEHGWMSYPRLYMGKLDEALVRIDRVMKATERNPELGVQFVGASLKGMLYQWLVTINYRTSPLGEVETIYEKGIRWVRARGEAENEMFLVAEHAQYLLLYAGELARGKSLAKHLRVLAEELASPVSDIDALRAEAACQLYEGDPQAALASTDVWTERVALTPTDLQNLALMLAIRARALSALGRHDEALESAREAVASVDETGAKLLLPDALHALVVAHLGRGELDDAEHAVENFEQAAQEMGAVNFFPQAKWFRAEICGARGESDVRRTLLHEAMDGFRARGAMGHVRTLASELGIEL